MDKNGFDMKNIIHNLEARAEAERQENLSLGHKIKLIRDAYGLTQKEFADMVQVTHAHISKIENRKDSPSNALLTVIIGKFNVNNNWLNNLLTEEENLGDRFIFNDFSKFVSNIKYLQKKYGLSKREMNGLFHISDDHLDNIDYLNLNGIWPSAIGNICKYFKISRYDMMNKNLDGSNIDKEKSDEATLSAEENTLLDIYNSCSSEDKKLLIGILNKFR